MYTESRTLFNFETHRKSNIRMKGNKLWHGPASVDFIITMGTEWIKLVPTDGILFDCMYKPVLATIPKYRRSSTYKEKRLILAHGF